MLKCWEEMIRQDMSYDTTSAYQGCDLRKEVMEVTY